MRFREFNALTEAANNEVYVVGDSHAVAIGTTLGLDSQHNLAIGGTSSTDPRHRQAIDSIPAGSGVIIAQGCNDAANASRAAIEGNRKPKDPQQIAANVAALVDAARSKNLKVTFVLFPNGDPSRSRWYGGPYQEAVRNAIKSAINVPIVDMEGSPLTDGLHATMGAYKQTGLEAKSKLGVGLGPANSKPGAPTTKDKTGTKKSFNLAIPSGKQGTDVVNIQKSLVALGYSLPVHGVDGIRGPETEGAIREFQKKYGLTVDGIPGPETVGKLNDVLRSNPAAKEKIEKIKTTTPVGYNARASAAGETGGASEATKFFISKGWTPAQAAGIVGNLQAESGANLSTTAVGDGGQAYGIAQWHPDRQANFKRVFGKDIKDSSFKEQLEFVQWELTNSESRAGNQLKQAKTPEEAAAIVDQYYERSSGIHRDRRIANAQSLAQMA